MISQLFAYPYDAEELKTAICSYGCWVLFVSCLNWVVR